MRDLGNSRAVRTSYVWLVLIPVAAKALQNAPKTVAIEGLAPPLEISLELPFTWLLLYSSALAFAVGNALYRCSCPDLIRIAANWGDFERQGLQVVEIIDSAKRYFGELRASAIKVRISRDTSNLPYAERERFFRECVKGEFWDLWRSLDVLRAPARVSTVFAFFLGFSLALCVLIEGLWHVIAAVA